MLQAQHGNPDMCVTQPAQIGINTLEFVSKYDAHREIRMPVEQVYGVQAGLHGGDLIAAISQLASEIARAAMVLPPY